MDCFLISFLIDVSQSAEILSAQLAAGAKLESRYLIARSTDVLSSADDFRDVGGSNLICESSKKENGLSSREKSDKVEQVVENGGKQDEEMKASEIENVEMKDEEELIQKLDDKLDNICSKRPELDVIQLERNISTNGNIQMR